MVSWAFQVCGRRTGIHAESSYDGSGACAKRGSMRAAAEVSRSKEPSAPDPMDWRANSHPALKLWRRRGGGAACRGASAASASASSAQRRGCGQATRPVPRERLTQFETGERVNQFLLPPQLLAANHAKKTAFGPETEQVRERERVRIRGHQIPEHRPGRILCCLSDQRARDLRRPGDGRPKISREPA